MTKIIKKILYETEAREALLSGIDQLANAVKVTLGPSGKCVVIDKQLGIPTLTKDGVTVANSIFLENQFESMGCEILKESAKQTAKIAGDGTTTAIILAQAFISKAMSLIIHHKKNPIFVARDFEKLTKITIDYIKKELSHTLQTEKECISIATIAANNDKDLGELIGKSVFEVGAKTPVVVEESNSLLSYSEMIEGYSCNGGLRSPYFYNVPGREYWQASDVSILILDRPLTLEKEIQSILDAHMHKNKFLFLICADCSPIIDSLLVLNATRNSQWHYRIAAAHSPDYGEQRLEVLNDIALLTGATIVNLDNSRVNRPISDKLLGHATYVKSSEKMTVIMNEDENRKESIENWIKELEGRLEVENDLKKKEFFKERIRKLKIGTLTLRIGGSTRYDVKERLDRVDDAVRASQCAIEEGFVIGGGISLLRAASYIPLVCKNIEEDVREAFCEALIQPFRQIIANSGKISEFDVIYHEIFNHPNKNWGINLNNEHRDWITYGDMVDNHIVDPTKVVCTALEKASSITATILTTDTMIADMTDVEAYNRMVNSLPMMKG